MRPLGKCKHAHRERVCILFVDGGRFLTVESLPTLILSRAYAASCFALRAFIISHVTTTLC